MFYSIHSATGKFIFTLPQHVFLSSKHVCIHELFHSTMDSKLSKTTRISEGQKQLGPLSRLNRCSMHCLYCASNGYREMMRAVNASAQSTCNVPKLHICVCT